jgi:hypothetical protein
MNSFRFVRQLLRLKHEDLKLFQDREKTAAHSSLLSKDQSVYEIGNHLNSFPTCALYHTLVDCLNKEYHPLNSPDVKYR